MNAAIDVREVLPAIRVPTLILHRTDDHLLTIEEGRYVASRIPGATLLELPGEDHLPFVGDQDAMLDAIEHFLGVDHDAVDADRVLATVVTAAVAPGSGETRVAFETLVRGEIERHRGRLLTLSADEVQAAFDGPARAIRCAAALATAGPRHARRVRAGLHTGECEAIGGAIRGRAVGVSQALSRRAADAEVLVSRTVVDLVAGSGLLFEARGAVSLAQHGGPVDVFAASVPAR
jgi:hypothetical protein